MESGVQRMRLLHFSVKAIWDEKFFVKAVKVKLFIFFPLQFISSIFFSVLWKQETALTDMKEFVEETRIPL